MQRTRSLVIAPFDSRSERVVDTARRALADIGVEVLRVDDLPAGASVTAAIIDAIRASDFVVVDITWQNPNVFYELGVAHSWRKPVILLAMFEPDQHIPSVLDGFPYIVYDSNDLRGLATALKRAASRFLEKQPAVA